MSIKVEIEEQLTTKLQPDYLNVTNESHMHHVPSGSETHFRIEVVSLNFEKQTLLKRHRLINELLKDILPRIRACSLYTLTPSEWEKKNGNLTDSPRCAGGQKTKG